MPDQVPRYDVFLSHNSADKAAVEDIARRLIAAGLQPFLDKWHLIPGAPWQEGLENALADSASVAVFVGPSGISPWHNEEMRVALDEAVRTRDDYRVIPVLLPGADETVVARFLARRTWVDFRAGLDDAEAFQRLVAGIQGQAIDIGPYRLPDEPAPYRGLLPFEAEHARFFFGRDSDIARLIEKLGRQTFVAIVGASGSGKSSLVKAGLLPRLKANALPDSGRWHILTMTPGSQPLRSFASQLATFVPPLDRPDAADKLTGHLAERPDGLRTALNAFLADRPHAVLLFIDQFEELFTLCSDGPEHCRIAAEQFIVNLADAAERGDGQVQIILTLRADFLGRCLAYPALRKLLEDRQLLLGPLAQADLRDAIVRPAQQVGALLEKGLVNTILTDVGDEPGNLPLLQHALHELWLARRGPWLTLDAYEASGGVRGALGRRAQATYDALPPEQQTIARAILLRLTALGEGISDTRRRAERTELYPVGADPAQVDAVIQALSRPDARLVVAEADSVEIAHEALIQGWSILRGWLEEDREALRTHRRLTDTANEWWRDRDESYLYRGVRLAEAEEWIATYAREMNTLEAEFVQASLALRDREVKEQIAAAGRLRRRARVAAAIGFIAFICAVFAIRFGLQTRWQALELEQRTYSLEAAATTDAERLVALSTAQAETEQERDTAQSKQLEAEYQRRIALSRELAVRSDEASERDPELSLLLASEAVKTTYRVDGTYTSEADRALYRALTLPLRRVLPGVSSASFSPDGTRIATTSADGTARLWNANGDSLTALEGHTKRVNSARFSPGGTHILTASDDGTARLWHADGTVLAVLKGHTGPVNFASFSPDGTRILTVSDDGTARLWNTDGITLAVLKGHTDRVNSASFSPDGARILTASGDGTARLWFADGTAVAVLKGHTDRVNSASFSPDGARILTASGDGTARLWLADGTAVAVLKGHIDRVNSASFSPDGTRILTASDDGTARLWYADGSPIEVFAQAGRISSAVFNPQGTRILTAECERTESPGSVCVAGTARLWDINGNFLSALDGDTSQVTWANFSPDGMEILTTTDGGPARLWHISSSVLIVLKDDGAQITSATFSPDGTSVITSGTDGTARLWDARGNPIAELKGHAGQIASASFNPDGTRILTVEADGTVGLWDASGKSIAVLKNYTERVVGTASFSPDGTRILTADNDNIVRLWDTNGNFLAEMEGHTASFSPDGTRIVTIGADGTLRLWLGSGEYLTRIGNRIQTFNSVRFSPDGTRMITESCDGGLSSIYSTCGSTEEMVQIWDQDGNHITTLAQDDGASVGISAEYSRAGSRIVTINSKYYSSSTIRLWSTAGNLLAEHGDSLVMSVSVDAGGTHVLIKHPYGISVQLWDIKTNLVTELEAASASFSPNERRIVGSLDNTARVWDVEGNLLATLKGHTGLITTESFNSDGTRVLTTSTDGTARLWEVWSDTDTMLADATRRAGRMLTGQECRAYLHVERCP